MGAFCYVIDECSTLREPTGTRAVLARIALLAWHVTTRQLAAHISPYCSRGNGVQGQTVECAQSILSALPLILTGLPTITLGCGVQRDVLVGVQDAHPTPSVHPPALYRGRRPLRFCLNQMTKPMMIAAPITMAPCAPSISFSGSIFLTSNVVGELRFPVGALAVAATVQTLAQVQPVEQ